MELYDTHAHLFDPQLAVDTAGVIDRAKSAGVTRILAVGTSADSSAQCYDLARQFPLVIRSSAGIHPNHAAEALPGDWARIEQLSHQPEVVALGETGLDLYWKDCPLELQQDYFERHIRLSQQTGLPLVIHLRETFAEILAMLQEARSRGALRGVMHSFTGTSEQAAEFLKLGMHISFAGMLTFKKSADLRAVAATIPADRLLVETDSPYLTPHPFRSQRPNEPRLVIHTAECLAESRGVSLPDLAALTTANALRLFSRG
ncbi:putative deoxyribonuclease YcfH [Anatilimnocola aggregata]|uniref:Putative deoxyribonuclease YcfH n=1 Tax=Anatilimnocola aggregata TaxID=2528021 RepID=A0A517YE13_9BACT|nr:TatD family hydrolase [Anatilimnocola aggregata]QDU28475.1 putative deoxyribonuclease YcfH [Anatilimnocola aggregata]